MCNTFHSGLQIIILIYVKLLKRQFVCKVKMMNQKIFFLGLSVIYQILYLNVLQINERNIEQQIKKNTLQGEERMVSV